MWDDRFCITIVIDRLQLRMEQTFVLEDMKAEVVLGLFWWWPLIVVGCWYLSECPVLQGFLFESRSWRGRRNRRWESRDSFWRSSEESCWSSSTSLRRLLWGESDRSSRGCSRSASTNTRRRNRRRCWRGFHWQRTYYSLWKRLVLCKNVVLCVCFQRKSR